MITISIHKHIARLPVVLGGVSLLIVMFGITGCDSYSIVYQRGIKQQQAGNVSNAMGWFEKSLEIDPDAIEPHLQLGLLYLDLEEYQQAIDHLTVSIDGGQSSAGIYTARGRAIYQRSHEVRDNYISTHMGEAAMSHNLHYAAIDDFTEAVAINSEYGSAYVERARANRFFNYHKDAIKDLRKAIELLGDDPEVLTMLASSLLPKN